MLAAQLCAPRGRLAADRRRGPRGRGTAYSTGEPAHLLNVRAEGMSAWADRPNDFAEAFESQGGIAAASPSGASSAATFGSILARRPGD